MTNADLLTIERKNRERIAAASAAMVAVIAMLFVLRQQAAPAAGAVRPAVAKADMLRVPPPSPLVKADQFPATFEDRWLAPPSPPPSPPTLVKGDKALVKITAMGAPPKAKAKTKTIKRGSICAKGKVWHRKANGWRTWRCRR